MSVQFLVNVTDQPKFRTNMILPNIFNEILYTGRTHVYLIHNGGTKHKVFVKKDTMSPNYKLYSGEWQNFLEDSGYVRVNTFHFIRMAPDEYYVTAYHNDGTECNGYDAGQVGHRQRRCMVILENLEESPMITRRLFGESLNRPLRVIVAGLFVATVNHQVVMAGHNRAGYVLSGHWWHVLVNVERFQVGQRIVITNLLNHSVSMVSFGNNGMGLKFERVPRMPLNEERPFMRSIIDDDERMQHECVWEGHEEFHDDEDDVFYAPLFAYVTDHNRLTIPHDFVRTHHLQQYNNAFLMYDEEWFYVDVDLEFHAENPNMTNHMNIKHRWKDIINQCYFEPNKMVRFKLIENCVDPHQTVNPFEPVMIPLFHMC